MHCAKCDVEVSESAWSGHVFGVHVGSTLHVWECNDCSFTSLHLTNALGHTLAETHQLQLQTWSERSSRLVNEIKELEESKPSSNEQLTEHRDRKKQNKMTKIEEMPQSQSKFSASESQEESLEIERSVQLSKSAVACARCGKLISCIPQRKVYHVIACFKLRPYVCSTCGKQSDRSDNLKQHIRKYCPSATQIMSDRVADEAKIRSGLVACFPKEIVKWNGF